MSYCSMSTGQDNAAIGTANRSVTKFPQGVRQISHSAPFVTEMCTYVDITVTDGALWDICLIYCGICEMGLLSATSLAKCHCLG